MNNEIPTPRTDDQIGYRGSSTSFINIQFVRTLERELAQCAAKLEKAREIISKYENVCCKQHHHLLQCCGNYIWEEHKPNCALAAAFKD